MARGRISAKPGDPWWGKPPNIGSTPDAGVTRNVRPAATPASASVRFDASENKRAIPFALGTVETPGSIRYAFKQGTTLWVVRALALGERSVTALGAESAGRIDGLVSIKTAEGTDGIALATPPYASWQYWFYDGALAQGVDPNLAGADASWNETAVLTDPVTGEQRGICYVVEKYFEFAKYWGKIGLPKWIYRIRGSRLYDPRTAATAYSENTFLQWRYWAMDPDGRYLAPAEVNGPAFNAAANIADEALGSGKRYASHLLIESGTTDDWLKMFRLLGDAYWFKNKAGLWTPLVDRPAAAVASYSDLHYTKSREPEIRSAQDALQVTNKVTIEYTDTSGTLWKQEPVSLSSDRLLAGQEPEVEATYRLPELHDRAIVETKLRYLLYSAQDDLRAMLNWRANTGDRALGDVVTQAIPERGLSDDFRVISIEPLEDQTFDVELQLMSARKYQDTTSSAPAKINSTMPEVYAATPPDPGLTVTQEGVNLKIELVPADSWAYYYRTRILVQKGSDPAYVLAEVEDGPVWLNGVAMGVPYTIQAITLSTVPALQSNVVSQAITPSAPAPEPPGLVQQTTVDGKTAYYLDGLPPVRSSFALTAGMLSQANLSAFTAALLVDGNRTNNAAQWDTASNNAYIQIDLGSAVAVREVMLRWKDRISVPALSLLYSDNGSAFTAVSGADFRTSSGPGDLELYTRLQIPAAVGVHRWWRLLKSDTLAYTSYLAEIEMATYTGATYRSDFIKGILLRGWTPNQIQNTNPEDTPLPNQPQTRQYLYLPIASNPVFDSFTQAYRQQSTDRRGFTFLSFGSRTYVEAATVNIVDEVSEFAGAYQATASASSNTPAFPPYSPQTYVPQAQEDVLVVNGANGSIAITHISDLFRLTGPTAAFSIGGIQFGVAGKYATLLNTTAATCTLLQEDASAPAAERFNFSATLSAGEAITVIYDDTLARWVRVAASSNAALANDAGYAPLSSPAFTGNPTAPTPAPGDNDTSLATTAFVQTGLAGKANTSHTHAEADVTGLVADLAAKAPLASPAFTGNPTAPTPAPGDNDTSLATTAFVQTGLAGKANTSHTHAEADVTGLVADLAAKAPLASPAFTGTPTAPTAVAGTNTTQIATTAFVQTGLADKANTTHTHVEGDVTGLVSDLAAKAPIASPTFTGTPAAPTATPGTNTTQIATTAFVQAGLAGKANTTHTHAEGDVTGLVADLAAKAPLASPAFTGVPTAPTPAAGDRSTKVATTDFVGGELGTFIDKASDTSYTTTTLTSDGELQFSLPANSTYEWEAVLAWQTANGTIGMSIMAPVAIVNGGSGIALITTLGEIQVTANNAVQGTDAVGQRSNAGAVLLSASTVTSNATLFARFRGVIRMGATGDTFAVQAATNNITATAKLLAGSFIRLKKLA